MILGGELKTGAENVDMSGLDFGKNQLPDSALDIERANARYRQLCHSADKRGKYFNNGMIAAGVGCLLISGLFFKLGILDFGELKVGIGLSFLMAYIFWKISEPEYRIAYITFNVAVTILLTALLEPLLMGAFVMLYGYLSVAAKEYLVEKPKARLNPIKWKLEAVEKELEDIEKFFDSYRMQFKRGRITSNIDQDCHWAFSFLMGPGAKTSRFQRYLENKKFAVEVVEDDPEAPSSGATLIARRVEKHTEDSLLARVHKLKQLSHEFGAYYENDYMLEPEPVDE